MPIDLRQTDTAGGCTFNYYCRGVTSLAGGTREMSVGGTAGSTEVGFTVPSAANRVVFNLVSPAIGETSWASGTYTIPLNFTLGAGSSKLTLEEVYICRVNSSCVNQATVGSETGIGLSLKNAVLTTRTISGAAQTASSTDKLLIVVYCVNADGMSNLSSGITPSELVQTPIVATGGATFPGWNQSKGGWW